MTVLYQNVWMGDDDKAERRQHRIPVYRLRAHLKTMMMKPISFILLYLSPPLCSIPHSSIRPSRGTTTATISMYDILSKYSYVKIYECENVYCDCVCVCVCVRLWYYNSEYFGLILIMIGGMKPYRCKCTQS